MNVTRRRKGTAAAFLMLVLLAGAAFPVFASESGTAEYVPAMYSTFWALVPPVVAIGLALITKEVYSSLFLGILVGGLFYSGFSFEGTVMHVFQGGIVKVLSDPYNVGILVFLVILGAIVSLMNRAGGSAAFGRWAGEHIKTRVGAQLATIALGVLIFIDDYFNCLTVGSVMRPVADKHNISRAKLSYLIDSTAAPVCIIAPISSWAAAVTGFVEGEDGLALFIRAIPFNFYALLTIVMMITIAVMNVDYGPMKKHEDNAKKGDIYTTPDRPYANAEALDSVGVGSVKDLLIPIVSLIVCCVIGMIYTGGFFEGASFVEAFSGSDASVGLAIGSIFALGITVLLYVSRKVLSFKDCMSCIPDGFKAMVPAILILTFAWTLKAMTDSLGAAEFVAALIKSSSKGLVNLLPAIIFVVGCLLAFATGTSWGTFGILIPIVVEAFSASNPTLMTIAISACMAGAVCGDHCSPISDTTWGTFGILIPIVVEAFSASNPTLMTIAISACMAGAVCGDHCSPISDTTIMASAGAQCNHVNHVSTQLPYAVSVAAVSFVTYIVAGFTQSAWISLPIGILLMIGFLFTMKKAARD